MEVTDALAIEKSWRKNPQSRPLPGRSKAVAAALVNHVQQLEEQLQRARKLAVGRQIQIRRGNPDRGPETGPGFGRTIPVVIVEVPTEAHQVRCELLVDDLDAVGAPCRAGDSGLWSISQIVLFA